MRPKRNPKSISPEKESLPTDDRVKPEEAGRHPLDLSRGYARHDERGGDLQYRYTIVRRFPTIAGAPTDTVSGLNGAIAHGSSRTRMSLTDHEPISGSELSSCNWRSNIRVAEYGPSLASFVLQMGTEVQVESCGALHLQPARRSHIS